jgi:hypothetical protein
MSTCWKAYARPAEVNNTGRALSRTQGIVTVTLFVWCRRVPDFPSLWHNITLRSIPSEALPDIDADIAEQAIDLLDRVLGHQAARLRQGLADHRDGERGAGHRTSDQNTEEKEKTHDAAPSIYQLMDQRAPS